MGGGNTYGIAVALNDGTVKSSDTPSGSTTNSASRRYLREVGLTIPATTIRGNNAETPVESLLDLDAENMSISYGAYVYKKQNDATDFTGLVRKSITNGNVGLF